MKRSPLIFATSLLFAVPSIAAAQQAGPPAPTPPQSQGGAELTSLRLMLQKGLISQAEYNSALADLTETAGQHAGDETSFVVGKWSTTLYGFAEGDYIVDSTQSFQDIPGAPLVAKQNTFTGSNPRTQFSVRNSRVGLRFASPEYHGIRASALFESDFVVTTAPVGYTQPYNQSENSFFTNPVMRVRHFYLKVENPVVDLLFGQTWHLFGWQSTYHPNTDQPQGVPGQIYSRTPQLRLSKTFKNDAVTFDMAVAAMRPPQRDSAIPEGEAGLHFAYNKWTATQTMGATGTTISPLSVAVTGDLRQFEIPNLAAKPNSQNGKTSSAIAVDAFVPVLPGTASKKGNSLSLLGELAYGYGYADLFTGLATGVVWPTLANPAKVTPAPTFNPDVDPNLVVYGNDKSLHAVQLTVYRGGLQYYLPGLDGKMWISGNYSRTSSDNAKNGFGPKGTTLDHYDWFDFNVMGDITPAVRLGIEYANYKTTFDDGSTATDHRVYSSAFYIF